MSESSDFYDLSYDEIVDKLYEFADRYPKLVRIDTGSQRYGIKFPSTVSQCSSKYGTCDVYIITLTNHETWEGRKLEAHSTNEGNRWKSRRPHIYLSGALHGNERVGPTAVMAAMKLLIEGYMNGQPWAVKMLDSRVIIATPMTNAHGYAHKKREENGIDPNRDFTYDLSSSNHASTLCMRTLCARVVNEIFREHLIQMSVTFHGGMRAIAYEWGGPNHPSPNDKSPDHAAQVELAAMMQYVSGTLSLGEVNYPTKVSDTQFKKKWWYPRDTLNKLVYPVKGGMEDWAYSGSWETKGDRAVNARCAPNTYGGYPIGKTEYNDAQLRAFNFLIETSDAKRPSKNWGKITKDAWWNDILRVNDIETDGHIPRNARISLFLISMVQPYVVLQDVSVEKGSVLQIQGVVGGCNTLDSWTIEWYSESDSNWKSLLNSRAMPAQKSKVPAYLTDYAIKEQFLLHPDKQEYQYSIPLNLKIDLTDQLFNEIGMGRNQQIKLRMSIGCDDNWYRNTLTGESMNVKSVPTGVDKPQSHIVNARHPAKDGSSNRRNGVFIVETHRLWPSEEYFVLKKTDDLLLSIVGSGIQKSEVSDLIADPDSNQELSMKSEGSVSNGEERSSFLDKILGREKTINIGSNHKRPAVISQSKAEQKSVLSELFRWELAGMCLIMMVVCVYCWRVSQVVSPFSRTEKPRSTRVVRSQRKWLI